MPSFTIDDLRRLMEAVRGPAGGDLMSDIAFESFEAAESFEALGYDSLALLEIQARVADEFGVVVPDDATGAMSTPRAAVAYFDTLLSEARGLAVAGHTDNSVVIEAPMSAVWDLTNDIASWPVLFSEYETVEIIESQDLRYVFRLTMYPDENGIRWSWVSERVLDPVARTVRSRRIETGPFEYMHIVWTYREAGRGTELRWIQDFAMSPGAPVDDAGMTRRINSSTAVQLDRIKRIVEAACGLVDPPAPEEMPAPAEMPAPVKKEEQH